MSHRRPLASLNPDSIQDQERQDTVDFRATVRENYGFQFFNNGVWVLAPPPPPVPDDDDEELEEEEEEEDDDEDYRDSDGDADDEYEDDEDTDDEDVEYVFDSDPEEPMEEQQGQ